MLNLLINHVYCWINKKGVIKETLILFEFLKKSFLTIFELMGSIEKLSPTFFYFIFVSERICYVACSDFF